MILDLIKSCVKLSQTSGLVNAGECFERGTNPSPNRLAVRMIHIFRMKPNRLKMIQILLHIRSDVLFNGEQIIHMSFCYYCSVLKEYHFLFD